MTQRKPLAIATALTLCSVPALAAADSVQSRSDMQIYGRAHLSVDHLDDGADYGEMNLSSNSSRLGFRGRTDFGAVTGIYQIEQEVDFSNSGADWASRDTFAGIRSGFGTLRAGKFDTPFKRARGPANLFGDQLGDMRNLTRVGDGRFDERSQNTIHYQTVDFNGLQLNLAYSFHEGDDAAEEAKEEAISVSATYKSGPLDLALAHEAWGEDTGRGERDGIRFAVGYDVLPALKVVGFYQSLNNDRDDVEDSTTMGAGAQYKAAAATYLRAHHFILDSNGDDLDAAMTAVGVEHRVDSALRVYANYAMVDNDDDQTLTPWRQARTTDTAGAAGETATGFSVGLRYDF